MYVVVDWEFVGVVVWRVVDVYLVEVIEVCWVFEVEVARFVVVRCILVDLFFLDEVLVWCEVVW